MSTGDPSMPEPRATPSEGLPLAAPSSVPLASATLDPLSAAAVAQLESQTPQKTWTQTFWLLLFTLVIFWATGFFDYTPVDLAILIAVLFFHESGHYLGMRIYGYRDVRMFFIPFFGAADSGRSTSVDGYKKAIIILLGPLPGIVLGVVLGIVCMFRDDELLRTATRMLLGINGFNLLPFFPLDGGQLLQLVLFCRQRYLEAVVRVVTGVLLGLMGWVLSAWLLAILGAWMLLSVGFQFRVRTLATELRGAASSSPSDPSAPIPREDATILIERVRQKFPEMKQAKSLASVARQVWEAVHVQPPGVAASIGLLGVYMAALFGTPIVAVLFTIVWQQGMA